MNIEQVLPIRIELYTKKGNEDYAELSKTLDELSNSLLMKTKLGLNTIKDIVAYAKGIEEKYGDIIDFITICPDGRIYLPFKKYQDPIFTPAKIEGYVQIKDDQKNVIILYPKEMDTNVFDVFDFFKQYQGIGFGQNIDVNKVNYLNNSSLKIAFEINNDCSYEFLKKENLIIPQAATRILIEADGTPYFARIQYKHGKIFDGGNFVNTKNQSRYTFPLPQEVISQGFIEQLQFLINAKKGDFGNIVISFFNNNDMLIKDNKAEITNIDDLVKDRVLKYGYAGAYNKGDLKLGYLSEGKIKIITFYNSSVTPEVANGSEHSPVEPDSLRYFYMIETYSAEGKIEDGIGGMTYAYPKILTEFVKGNIPQAVNIFTSSKK